jgi:predicted nucleic acid-binding protein
MIKAVYDTNVIVSAALYEESLPALLLSLALEGEVGLFVSL